MNSIPEAILITGASQRLGLVYAKKCIQLGFSVLLHYRTMHRELETLLASEPQFKNNIFLIKQELSDNPEKLLDTALTFPVTIVGLVNNASIFTEGNLHDYTHFEHIFTNNALTPLRLSNYFYQKIRRGWIINITDAMCSHSNIRYQNYRISKYILELLTQQQALLFAPTIRVNGIAPGAILPAYGENEYFKNLKNSIPLKKTGDIASLLNAFSFLIETPYIAGEIVKIDGGWNIL